MSDPDPPETTEPVVVQTAVSDSAPVDVASFFVTP